MDETQLQVIKAIEWERAKGQLRAVCAVAGHKRLVGTSASAMEAASAKWAELDRMVEAFIADIEDNALNE